jgi:hypothetical protein
MHSRTGVCRLQIVLMQHKTSTSTKYRCRFVPLQDGYLGSFCNGSRGYQSYRGSIPRSQALSESPSSETTERTAENSAVSGVLAYPRLALQRSNLSESCLSLSPTLPGADVRWSQLRPGSLPPPRESLLQDGLLFSLPPVPRLITRNGTNTG